MIFVDATWSTGYVHGINPTCVGERRNIMKEQLFLFGPSTGVIHGAQPGFSPTQAVGGSSFFKRCYRCGKTKPKSDFYPAKDKSDGLCGDCKLCRNTTAAIWRNNNKKKRAETAKRWFNANRQKAKAYRDQWRKLNPDKVTATGKKHDSANAEKRREHCRKWHHANPEKAFAKAKRWREANKEKTRATSSARRALAKNAAGYDYTTVDHIKARWLMFGGRCWICDRVADHTDHVIPLCVGGSHWPSNLRPACAKCNLSRPKDGSDLPTRKR